MHTGIFRAAPIIMGIGRSYCILLDLGIYWKIFRAGKMSENHI